MNTRAQIAPLGVAGVLAELGRSMIHGLGWSVLVATTAPSGSALAAFAGGVLAQDALMTRSSVVPNDRFGLRIQPIDATHWLNRSAGVSKFNVFLGRSFNCRATALRLVCE